MIEFKIELTVGNTSQCLLAIGFAETIRQLCLHFCVNLMLDLGRVGVVYSVVSVGDVFSLGEELEKHGG